MELARLLIETFEQHVGKTYGDLLIELEGYEEMNYRFIRGLSQLLGRRAVIETDAAVDPSLARETVFEACNGMALSLAEKKVAFQKRQTYSQFRFRNLRNPSGQTLKKTRS